MNTCRYKMSEHVNRGINDITVFTTMIILLKMALKGH